MNKRILQLFTVLACIMCVKSVSAQDIHFSQFYMSPLNLNPALTGVMNCNTRMVVNYRNQWATALKSNAYNTYSASYDQKIPVGRSDYFGIGGSLYGDVAGETRFGTTQGRLSLAYSKKMGGYRKKSHYLVIGADGGFAQRRIDILALKYPNQHDGEGGHDATISSGELIDQNGYLYPDVTAGLLWFSVFDQYNNFYVGASMSHLNQANQSFREDVFDPLYTRLTLHAGGQFSSTPKVSVLPGFVFFAQGPHREFNFGTSLRFNLGNSRLSTQSFQFGGWYRIGTNNEENLHSDALILSTRFNYEHFNLGFSYDLTVSGFNQANFGVGAFEFSLGYDICGPENRGVYCPKF